MGNNAVRRGTTTVSNTDDNPSQEQNYEAEYTQEAPKTETPPAQEAEKTAEGNTQEAKKTAEGNTQEGDTGGENNSDGSPAQAGQAMDPEQFAAALAKHLGQNPQQQNQAEEQGPPDPESQKTEIQQSVQQRVEEIEGKRQELQKQMDEGDIDPQQYIVQSEQLTQQRYETERDADRQITAIDSQLAVQQQQAEQQQQQARAQYAEQNPDFIQMYESGELQQAMQDPQLQSVFGDNPAAAHQYLRSQKLSTENTELKQQIETLKQAQAASVQGAAQDPNRNVGRTSGDNHPKTTQEATQGSTAEDTMLAALRSSRQGV